MRLFQESGNYELRNECMEKKFDHLMLLIKQNKLLREAYEAGKQRGQAEEKEANERRYAQFRDWIDNRVKTIPNALGNLKGMKLSQENQRSVHTQVRQWNVDGYLTALKSARKIFTL